MALAGLYAHAAAQDSVDEIILLCALSLSQLETLCLTLAAQGGLGSVTSYLLHLLMFFWILPLPPAGGSKELPKQRY